MSTFTWSKLVYSAILCKFASNWEHEGSRFLYLINIGMFLRRIKAYINAHGLLVDGQRVIVALSGGADSVALLLVLQRLGYACEAVHCNFHLRGDESCRDERFVRSLCQRLSVPLQVVEFHTTAYAASHHISIEMAARDLRYDYFRKAANEAGITAVAVAHHLNDSAETFLLNLMRGTGINGLRGIRPKNGLIVRPLLCVTRQEILSFLHGMEQPYVTDSTNLQDDFTRNKIRLKLLPLMQTINPSVQQSIVATADRLSELANVYDKLIGKGKSRVTAPLSEAGEGAFAIDDAALQREPMPESLLFELLRPLGFNSAQVRSIYAIVRTETSGRTFTSSTWRVVKDRSRLLVTPLSATSGLNAPSAEEITIEEDGTVLYDGKEAITGEEAGVASFDGNKHLCVSIMPRTEDFVIPRSKQCVCLDADKLRFPLTLRRWRLGDKFVPLGMKGTKKVSDYLTDRKFSLLRKERQWVLCSTDRIVWLVGERPDDRFKVQEATRRLLRAELITSPSRD